MNQNSRESFLRCTGCGSTYDVRGWLCDSCQKRAERIVVTTVVFQENQPKNMMYKRKKFVL